MNLLTKLSLAVGAVLVAAVLLAAGIYYIARPAENAPQTAAASPAPVGAVREPSLPPTRPLSLSLPRDTTPGPSDPLILSPSKNPTLSPTQPLNLSPSKDPTLPPTQPPILSPSKDPTLSPTQPPILGPSQDPTPAPAQSAGPEPVKGPTAGSDDQVQLIPKKETPKYPNLGSQLNQLVASVEAGQATAREAAREAPIHQDESVAVTIHLSGSVDGMVRFLEDNGGDSRNVGEDYIEAYVPVTLLGQVSELTGVNRVREIIPPQPAGPSQRGGPARP